ncbi:hypothetical protein YC2023_018921 [Brassica napus]
MEVHQFVSPAHFSLALSRFRERWVRLAWLHFQFLLGELLSKEFGRLDIQGVWTEKPFPLSSYEVSGSWSYRLAGKAAAISVVGCRSGGYRVAGYGQQR